LQKDWAIKGSRRAALELIDPCDAARRAQVSGRMNCTSGWEFDA